MKNIIALCTLIMSTHLAVNGQTVDTVSLQIGEQSKFILNVYENDLETVKQYDFQKIVSDAVQQLEHPEDTTKRLKSADQYLSRNVSEDEDEFGEEDEAFHEDEDYDCHDDCEKHFGIFNDDFSLCISKHHRAKRGKILQKIYGDTVNKHRKFRSSFYVELGMNNYLENGKFPKSSALYAVKPWGSWSVSLLGNVRTKMGRKVFLDFGGGITWNNYKFENPGTNISKDNNQLTFFEDPRDFTFKKSKLTAFYLTASLLPTFDSNNSMFKNNVLEGNSRKGFRFGVGPFVSYRVASHSKIVFKEEGKKKKEKNRDGFYLNNLQYGLKAQFGLHRVDFFIQYAFNNLFQTPEGPKLNAFSFGISL